MGLIDGILGGLLGGSQQAQGANQIVQLALQVLQQNGGLTGVLDKLKSSGLGQQAESWVGTGGNLPVSPEQISQALGGADLGELAAKLGLPAGAAPSGLAEVLPRLIDQMTPQGQVPANHTDLVSQALGMLGKLGSR
ncbi:MAG TPA: YidB family protein [Thermoanaerobaculia bacterium]|nr:YidB family protein [Thermoanaerobaculia bacterium]HQR67828.1 YidB family protein [Thermoanaerobaculia bacterium]